MTVKIMDQIEKLLRVKRLHTDQELAPKVNLSSRRVLDKGFKRPEFDIVHKNKQLHEFDKKDED
jgi:hypothetical protein